MSSYIRRSLIALLLLVVGSASSSAQVASISDSSKARFTLGSTQTMAGFIQLDFTDLNARLAAAGLPIPASGTATIGIGSDLRSGRWMFGAAWQSVIARSASDAAHRTRMSGSLSLFDMGFAVIQRENFSAYHIVGLGATHATVGFKTLGDFSFNDGLDHPERELTVSGTTALVHAAMLVECRFHRESGAEFAMSFRMGVLQSIGHQSWGSAENSVTGGPTGVRGSYLRIALSKPMGSKREAILPILTTIVQTAAQ